MSKKLAFYLVQFAGGGVEKLFETLAIELYPFFSKVDVVVCNGNSGNFDTKDRENILIHNLNCNTGYGEMYAITSFFKLIRYLKTNNPDTIISCPGFCNIIAILACRLSGANTKVVSIIDNRISLLKQNRWYHRILFFFFKRFLKFADKIVVPYSKAKDDIIDNVVINPSKVHIIPHPVVDSTLFKNAEKPIDNYLFLSSIKSPKFLYVGRLSEEKGVFVLLDAFKRVQSKMNALLYIIGDGVQMEEVTDWIKTNRLDKKVILLGYQKNPYPYYKQCDLLVVPSKVEAFGLVIVEALALGCPVAATDTKSGGPRSILCSGKYGKLCKANDIDSLADGILSSYRAKWNKDILRQRGLDYSVESSMEKYMKLL